MLNIHIYLSIECGCRCHVQIRSNFVVDVEAWVDVLAPRAVHSFNECPQMPHKVPVSSAGTKPGGFGYSLVGALDSPSHFSQELHDRTSSFSLFWRPLAPGTSGVSSKA